jgi:hypothetical protein
MHLNKRQHMELLKDRLKEMFHEKNSLMKHNLKPVSQNGNFYQAEFWKLSIFPLL